METARPRAARREEQIVPSASCGRSEACGRRRHPGGLGRARPGWRVDLGPAALIAELLLMMIFFFLNHSSPQFSGLIYSGYW